VGVRSHLPPASTRRRPCKGEETMQPLSHGKAGSRVYPSAGETPLLGTLPLYLSIPRG
jgi:hypothetical protein